MELRTGLAIGLLCLGTAGCTTAGGRSARDAAITDYVDCNVYSSHKVAAQAGDPVSLGVAAASMCSAQLVAYGQIVQSQSGPDVAIAAMREMEQSSAKSNAATIVQARIDMVARQKAAPKTAPRPQTSA